MTNSTTLRALSKTTFGSAGEALTAGGLNWGVDLETVTTASGKTAPARAVVRDDTRQPLGVVGLRYTPCNNLEASRWLDAYVPHGLKITGAESFKGGERCVMYGVIGEKPKEIQPGDVVCLQLVASWSHDGTSSTTGQIRVLRLACSNGLVMASDAGRMFSLRHTRNADPSAETIQAQVREALARFGESIDAYRALAGRSINRGQVREYVRETMQFPADDEMSTRGANVLQSILDRYEASTQVVAELLANHERQVERERAANASLVEEMLANFDGGRGQQINGGGSWWNAYNAVTEHLTHSRGANPASRAESLLFGTAARINERALNVAMSMSGVA